MERFIHFEVWNERISVKKMLVIDLKDNNLSVTI